MTGAAPNAGYLRRLRPELPVLATAAAAPAIVGGLSLALHGDEIPLLLAHLAVLVLATGSAYLFDDSATDVTRVVPTSLLRRRLVILLRGLPFMVLSWGAVMTLLTWRSPSAPLTALSWEVSGLSSLGVAAAAILSRRGEPEPGNLVASVLGLGVIGVLICQPMFSVTVLVTDPASPARAGWWAAVIVGSTATFVVASRDRAASRLLQRRTAG
jgi:hypothetical protein